MTKERCPFLSNVRDGNGSECECVQEQCMFYRAEDSKCVFLPFIKISITFCIGILSR